MMFKVFDVYYVTQQGKMTRARLHAEDASEAADTFAEFYPDNRVVEIMDHNMFE